MSTESTLRKEGVQVVKALDTLNVNLIAQKIANKLCDAFPEHGFSSSDLFASISRLNMYLAKMDDSLCGAKYYYKNNSIYFNIDYPLGDVDSFTIHECIHYLQEQKDTRGNLVRLGLYDFSKNHGMAINEAAVQLMTVAALNIPAQNVTYYSLNLPTDSLDCYPLECAIVKQMAYFTGTYPLYHSTIRSNDVFKNTFITLSSKQAYGIIETNLDRILELENTLAIYFDELKTHANNISEAKTLNSIIDKTKEEIVALFFKCQNTIISHCFSYDLNNVRSAQDIKNLKNKIYNFQSLIATNPSYEFYNEFYRRLMEALDEKVEHLEEYNPFEEKSTALTVINRSKSIVAIFRRLFIKLGLIKQEE